jgi:hypothetical protein
LTLQRKLASPLLLGHRHASSMRRRAGLMRPLFTGAEYEVTGGDSGKDI